MQFQSQRDICHLFKNEQLGSIAKKKSFTVAENEMKLKNDTQSFEIISNDSEYYGCIEC